MSVVLLAVHRLPAALLAGARAACAELGLAVEEWSGGIPRRPPIALVDAVEPGARRLPPDLLGLFEATPGLRAVLCAEEPLVKPHVSLAEGRVTLLAPPVDHRRLVATLRAVLWRTPAAPSTAAGAVAGAPRRFEALRRAHWLAWSGGEAAPALALDEDHGATLVIGPGAARAAALAGAIATDDADDLRCEARLAAAAGDDTAVVHLAEHAAEWRVYWPAGDRPLWFCSPHRLPPRWDASAAILDGGRRWLRWSAYPGDLLVAGWAAAALPDDAFAPLLEVVDAGGVDTLAGLAGVAARHPGLGAVVVEVR